MEGLTDVIYSYNKVRAVLMTRMFKQHGVGKLVASGLQDGKKLIEYAGQYKLKLLQVRRAGTQDAHDALALDLLKHSTLGRKNADQLAGKQINDSDFTDLARSMGMISQLLNAESIYLFNLVEEEYAKIPVSIDETLAIWMDDPSSDMPNLCEMLEDIKLIDPLPVYKLLLKRIMAGAPDDYLYSARDHLETTYPTLQRFMNLK